MPCNEWGKDNLCGGGGGGGGYKVPTRKYSIEVIPISMGQPSLTDDIQYIVHDVI